MHQRILWTSVEGKPDISVFIFGNFDAKHLAVALRFSDYFFGNIVMMNIDGAALHMLDLSFFYCLHIRPGIYRCSAKLNRDQKDEPISGESPSPAFFLSSTFPAGNLPRARRRPHP